MSDDIDAWLSERIDAKLERLYDARLRQDDVARAWHKATLAGLVTLRRVRRESEAAAHGDKPS